MLTLARKVGESVLVDSGRIKVTVMGSRGGRVLLSFDAPECVRIERSQDRPLPEVAQDEAQVE